MAGGRAPRPRGDAPRGDSKQHTADSKGARSAPGTSNIQIPTSNIAPAEHTVARSPQSARTARPAREPRPGFVAVGRVLGPFGVKGEIKVQPLTDNPRRFAAKSRVWAGEQLVTVAESREAGGYVYVRLKGFGDRTSAERFRHALLQVPEESLPPLPEGEYYRFQLIGLRVFDRAGEPLGTLDEVLETGANDVYRVRRPDGSDLLLPALDDVILSVDLVEKRMVVDPPEWR